MHDVVNHMPEGEPVFLRIVREDEDVRQYQFLNEGQAETFLNELPGTFDYALIDEDKFIIEEGWVGGAAGRPRRLEGQTLRPWRLDVQPDLFGQWCFMREWGRIGLAASQRAPLPCWRGISEQPAGSCDPLVAPVPEIGVKPRSSMGEASLIARPLLQAGLEAVGKAQQESHAIGVARKLLFRVSGVNGEIKRAARLN